jgi:hypothetical protein
MIKVINLALLTTLPLVVFIPLFWVTRYSTNLAYSNLFNFVLLYGSASLVFFNPLLRDIKKFVARFFAFVVGYFLCVLILNILSLFIMAIGFGEGP